MSHVAVKPCGCTTFYPAPYRSGMRPPPKSIRKINTCMKRGKKNNNRCHYWMNFHREGGLQTKRTPTYWAFIIFRSFMFQCVHYKCIAPLEHHSTLSAFVLSFYFVIFRGLSFGLFHFFPSLYQLHGNLSWKKHNPWMNFITPYFVFPLQVSTKSGCFCTLL